MDAEIEVAMIKKMKEGRRCAGSCGTILSIYNTSKFCCVCRRKRKESGEEKSENRLK